MLEKNRYTGPPPPPQSPRLPGNVRIGAGEAPVIPQCSVSTCITCSKNSKRKDSLNRIQWQCSTRTQFMAWGQNARICHNQNHGYILSLWNLFCSSPVPCAGAPQFPDTGKKNHQSMTSASHLNIFKGRWRAEFQGWKYEPAHTFLCGVVRWVPFSNRMPWSSQSYSSIEESIVLVQMEKLRQRKMTRMDTMSLGVWHPEKDTRYCLHSISTENA